MTTSFVVRPAALGDVDAIVPWTTATFEWGDYVPERLRTWIEDADSRVLVCDAGEAGPVAMCHAVMLSPTEGWLEAARVHPDHKRSGLGSALNRAGCDWLAERGARVVRLATESSNRAGRLQVEALGYRHTSTWVFGHGEPPETDGGSDLVRASPGDADSAWVEWASGGLAAAGRELMAIGWRWRRTRPDDLLRAAEAGELYRCDAGWAILEEHEEGAMRSTWVHTSPRGALTMLDALLGLAGTCRARSLSVKLPASPWAAEAMTRAGLGADRVMIYAKAPVG